MWGRETCAYESVVLQAPAGTELTADARAHLAGCPRCQEALAAGAWMRRLADTAGETRDLPDASLLWWRAQLVQRWNREREATAAVEVVERVELLVGLVSLIALLVWQGPRLWAFVRGTTHSWDALAVTRWAAAVDGSLALTLVPFVTALLAVATLVTVTRLMIAD